jgi:hypothetical protein
MAQDVFINITDLPQATEARAGDYFIIETSTGTQIINFSDIIMPIDNTLITNLVNTHTDQIVSLSLSADNIYGQIDTTNSTLASLNSSLTTLQAQVDNSPSKTDIDTLTAQITNISSKLESTISGLDKNIFKSLSLAKIIQNARTTSLNIKAPEGVNLQIDDVIIVAKNNYAIEYTKDIFVSAVEVVNEEENEYKIDIEASFRNGKLKANQAQLDAIISSIGSTSLSTMNVTTLFNTVLSKYIEIVYPDDTLASASEEAHYTIIILKDY